MSFLDSTEFVDLYIGRDYADLKELPGAQSPVRHLDGPELAKAMRLREACLVAYATHQEPDFAHQYEGVRFRVTVIATELGGEEDADLVLILRRLQAAVMDFDTIGVEPGFAEVLTHEKFRGLTLVVGEQGVGKSTTAGALLVKRTALHGGIGLAIEHPPEIRMGGVHGKGRVIQVGVSRRLGTFSEQLVRAMRAGTSNLLIGEIRDYETASEAIRHSNNGTFVAATMHASGPAEAIERLIALAAKGSEANVRRLLSLGLAAVVHQSLLRRLPGSATSTTIRPIFRTLMVAGPDNNAVRALIRDGNAHQLDNEIESQSGRAMWRP